MKRKLKRLYHRVGKETFCRGLKNGIRLISLLIVFLIFGAVAAGCREESHKDFKVYEVVQEQMYFESSADNHRVKVPVVKDVVYYIVEKES